MLVAVPKLVPPVQLAVGANVAPTASWTGGTSFGTATNMVRVNVRYDWASTFRGRARAGVTESLIAGGTKK